MAELNTKRTCAWLSRHAPFKEQRAVLERAGYRIVQVQPPDRFHNSGDMWATTQLCCGGIPDLIVVLAPKGMVEGLMKRAGDVPIVKPDTTKKDGRIVWLGTWRQLITLSVEWTPEKGG